MKHYHGYWQVLAIIKQYLANIKKRLAQDLKSEQEDPGLPESNFKEPQNKMPKVDKELKHDRHDSSHIRNPKDLEKTTPKKTKKHSAKGPLRVFESEDGESDFKLEGGSEDEDEDDGGETDLEDDAAEMEMLEFYCGALDSSSKQEGKNKKITSLVRFLSFYSVKLILFY